MTYSFEYIHSVWGHNIETGGQFVWNSIWDAERIGELHIVRIDATTDGWETSFEVYRAED